MRITKLMTAALLTGLALASGCGSIGSRPETLGQIQPGMSREQVLEAVGDPKYVAATNGTEYLWYDVRLKSYTHRPWLEPYYVKLTDGQVESYGKPDQYAVQAGNFTKYDSPARMNELVPSDPDYGRTRLYGEAETER